MAFCPTCGTPFAARRQKRRRRGNFIGSGLLLGVLGGWFLFVPWAPSGNMSLWQEHDLCASVFGIAAPSDCSTVTLLWAVGLGILGLGAFVVISNLLGFSRDEQPSNQPSTFIQPIVSPPAPSPAAPDLTKQIPPSGSHPRWFEQRWFGISLVTGGLLTLGLVLIAALGGMGGKPSSLLDPTSSPEGRPSPVEATHATSTTPIPTTASAVVDAEIPVIPCATTYGGDEVQQPTEPTTSATVPASLADQLAIFATNEERVMAPRAWRCVAGVGANGTALLTLDSGLAEDKASITVEDAAVSYGYVLDLACPLFPEAAQLNKDQGMTCGTPPKSEEVSRIGETVARFEDPPGIAGTGTKSGGPYPAVGAVWFTGGQEIGGAKITCVLPVQGGMADVCVTVVDEWLQRFGQPTR